MRILTDTGETIVIGTTEAEPTIGIVDYSRRTTDAFGVTTVVKRNFSRRMSVRVAIPSDQVDVLQRRLAALRATPVTWIADDRFASLTVRGFFKDLEFDLAVPPLSFCTLTVESIAGGDVPADAGGDPAPAGIPSSLQLLQPLAITDAALASSSVAENDAPAWAATTTYPKGARVISAARHRIYESLVAGNKANDPAEAGGMWLDLGPTNRWAMFDDALGTSTSSAASIVVRLDAGAATAVALLDVKGATVRVQATGYDRTQPVGEAAITFLDLPANAGQITVTIAGTGTKSVGTLLVGRIVALGVTEASPTAGITDYSRKEVDDFGEVTIVERPFAKRMAARSLIDTAGVDLVANRLAAVRARPCLWIGQAGLDSLTIYGFFKDFSISVGPTVSKLSLSIEGLSTAGELKPLGSAVNWPDIADPDGTKPAPNADKTSENVAKDTAAVGGKPATEVVYAIDDLYEALGTTESAQEYADAARDAQTATETAKAQSEAALTASRDAAAQAADYKTGAETARNIAQTARDQTNTALAQANTARDAAQAALELTNTARDASVQANTNAQAALTGANSARADAIAKAGEAAGSATTAAGHATTASQQANSATGSASAAAGSAVVAQSSAQESAGAAQMQGRSPGAAPSTWGANQHSQPLPTNRLSNTPGVSVSTTKTILTVATTVHIHPIEMVPLVQGRRYAARARWRLTSDAAQPQGHAIYIYFFAADGSYISGAQLQNIATATVADGWKDNYRLIGPTTANGAFAYPANAAFYRVMYRTSGAPEEVAWVYAEDVEAQLAAEGSASAAASSASSANTLATQTGTSASAANQSKLDAATEAGKASTSATNAAASATNAAGSANTATQQAGLAGTSATQAGGSATAAGNSATTAGTHATNAGNSASAANTSAISAASSYSAAKVKAIATLPDVIATDTHTLATSGVPETRGDVPADRFVDGAIISPPNSSAVANFKGVVPWKLGRIYEVTVEVSRDDTGTGTLTNAAGYARVLASDFGVISAVPERFVWTTMAQGTTQRIVTRFGMGVTPPAAPGILAAPALLESPTNAYVRFGSLFNYGNPAGNVSRLKLLMVRDVTEQLAAESSASAASTSASTADTRATAAGQSATAAAASATTASTKAGEASTSATNAAGSATNAAGSANSAASSASVAATNYNSARLAMAATFPETINGDLVTVSAVGPAATRTPISVSNPTWVVDNGAAILPPGVTTTISLIQTVRATQGDVFEVTADVENLGTAAGNFRFYYSSLDDNFVAIGADATSGNWTTIQPGERAVVRRRFGRGVTASNVASIPAASTNLRITLQQNRIANGSAGDPNVQMKTRALYVRNVTAEKAAADYASAAATSENTAATKAAEAGTSASTASTAANTATTKAGEASADATRAATSATNAAGSANSASASATVSATSANAALGSSSLLFPDRMTANGDYFFDNAYLGDPATVTMTAAGKAKLLNQPGYGWVYNAALSTREYFSSRGVIPVVLTDTYEIEVEYEVVTFSGTNSTFNVWSISLNATYGQGGVNRSGGWPVNAAGVFTRVFRIGAVSAPGIQTIAWEPDTAFARPMVGSSVGFAGSDVRIRRVSVRNITQRIAAEGAASAAATSASAASTAQTAAGQSATAASTSATNAETAKGQAQTFANTASTSASNALGSAQTASTQAGVASTAAGASTAAADAARLALAETYPLNLNANVLNSNGAAGVNSVLPSIATQYPAWVTDNGASITPAVGWAQIAPIAAVTLVDGEVYEFVAIVENIGSVPARTMGYYRTLNADYSGFANYNGAVVETQPGDKVTVRSRFGRGVPGIAGVTNFPAGAIHVRPLQLLNRAPGSTAVQANAQMKVTALYVRNITTELLANGAAQAAAGSSATASTKATEASQSATAAQGSATTAATKAGEAGTSAAAASTSASDALGSKNAAATSASTAATARDQADAARGQAQAAASAAATSESNAAASKSGADSAASAASTAKIAAETARGQAQTSATNAATSESNAEGSKNSAATSAGLAAGSATNAAGSATAAGTSASSASTSATNAGNSASAANQSRLDAQAANGSAQTAATTATNAATSATASASSAQSSASVASRFSGQSLARNPSFQEPAASWVYSAATTYQLPAGWSLWLREGSPVIAPANAQNVYGSQAPLQIDRAGTNLSSGVVQTLPPLGKGWYVLEADVTLEDGLHNGAGMYIDFGAPGSGQLSFGADPDTSETVSNGGMGSVNRKFSKLIYCSGPSAAPRFYLMASWSGFGTRSGFLRTIWHKGLIRPATQGEIDGKQARFDAGANAARIETVNTALSNQLGSVASQTSALTARMAEQPKNYIVRSAGAAAQSAGRATGLFKATGERVSLVPSRSYRVYVKFNESDEWATSNFDIYGGGEAAANAMAAYLNGIGTGQVVVVSTIDEPSNGHLNAGLVAAMRRCGAGPLFTSPEFNIHGAYALVGRAGLGAGNGIEWLAGSSATNADAWIEQPFSLIGNTIVGSGAGKAIESRVAQESAALATATSAVAQRASNLESRAGNLESKTSITEQTVADLKSGAASARLELLAAAPGGRAKMTIRSDATSAGIDLEGDVNFSGKVIFNNGTVMFVQGLGFGSAGQFLEWLGPSKANLNQCTEAEAIRYVKMDGSAYFRGTFLAGSLRSSTANPGVGQNVTADTGLISSNGGAIVVQGSWDYTWTQVLEFPATTQGIQNFDSAAAANGATDRGANNWQGMQTPTLGSNSLAIQKDGTTVASVSMTTGTRMTSGWRPIAGDSPGRLTVTTTMALSTTYSDPERSTRQRAFRAVLTRGYVNVPTSQFVGITTVE